jgi:hypothetical protein
MCTYFLLSSHAVIVLEAEYSCSIQYSPRLPSKVPHPTDKQHLATAGIGQIPLRTFQLPTKAHPTQNSLSTTRFTIHNVVIPYIPYTSLVVCLSLLVFCYHLILVPFLFTCRLYSDLFLANQGPISIVTFHSIQCYPILYYKAMFWSSVSMIMPVSL